MVVPVADVLIPAAEAMATVDVALIPAVAVVAQVAVELISTADVSAPVTAVLFPSAEVFAQLSDVLIPVAGAIAVAVRPRSLQVGSPQWSKSVPTLPVLVSVLELSNVVISVRESVVSGKLLSVSELCPHVSSCGVSVRADGCAQCSTASLCSGPK